ncbi:ABC transporter permease [Dictyobacter aurantiacus]|uniref:Peptide ABC transporter permease n=1 Tax=Dictyobacter aurantiacus TaxID=1936993 RepID=A0A401ZSU6_9CHLR|nr:ABC transporter permease [Dictyobacter aurantiacus]GCE09882.1 peptide ABC transporter permease [Dictyobacter aurantiacus]
MRYLLRRISFYIVTAWVSLTINFFLPRLVPGDPAQAILARFRDKNPSPEMIQALEIQFGISHDPLWVQYLQYLNNLFHGNLGVSTNYFPTAVSTIIAQRMPWTLGLGLVTLLISFILGTLLGVLNAWKRGTRVDTIISPMIMMLSGIPYFWLAFICLYVFGFTFNWFPLNGGYDEGLVPSFDPDFMLSVLSHAILPALTIIVSSLAGWMLTMRNTMITTLSEDYILMAQAKGLSRGRVMLRYAARNAILPSITSFALALGFIVSGQLLTETVFSYPGIGFAFVQAIGDKDYALMQGVFLILSLAVLAANFIADLTYAALDPRVRVGGK